MGDDQYERHHQSELLKEFNSLLVPVTASISSLQGEVSRLQGMLSDYQTSMKSMTEEITASSDLSTDHNNGSNCTIYHDTPVTTTITLTSKPQLESTARPEMTRVQIAPGGAT
ncbi:hypothetical protein AMECASPLE_031123 [Ameca splendens]|uniref:Uncharacterized protein n=1 Tax=Ameca splendens TaxID=208324 RepID=A0ABV0XVI8_9TELE